MKLYPIQFVTRLSIFLFKEKQLAEHQRTDALQIELIRMVNILNTY
jgi:hypothetical protein